MAELTQIEHSTLTPVSFSSGSAVASDDPSVALGVVVLDLSSGRLHYRVRHDLDSLLPDSDLSSFQLVESIVEGLIRRHDGRTARDLLVRDGVDGLRASEPKSVTIDDLSWGILRLYRLAVGPVALRKFDTHLPFYTLEAAGGRFLDNAMITPSGWLEVRGLKDLTKDHIVVRVKGTSMEPNVPDGSYLVLRVNYAGSRAGKDVVVEERGAGADAYTLKRYFREFDWFGEDNYCRKAVILKSYNKNFEDIVLNPFEDKFRILGVHIETYGPELIETLIPLSDDRSNDSQFSDEYSR